jgi:hypothetical protein
MSVLPEIVKRPSSFGMELTVAHNFTVKGSGVSGIPRMIFFVM